MKTTRILIADDHPLVRRGLRGLLESRDGWEVCGEASTGPDAVAAAQRLNPDIVIIDLSMPDVNGFESIQRIRSTNPDTHILTLTMHDAEPMFRGAMKAGAQGYVLKSDMDGRLIEAVEALCENRAFFSPSISHTIMEGLFDREGHDRNDGEDPSILTRRQQQVVRLLAEGKSNKEVASMLGISVRTAETHRRQIMIRLGIQSLSELVLFAVRNHLVQP